MYCVLRFATRLCWPSSLRVGIFKQKAMYSVVARCVGVELKYDINICPTHTHIYIYCIYIYICIYIYMYIYICIYIYICTPSIYYVYIYPHRIHGLNTTHQSVGESHHSSRWFSAARRGTLQSQCSHRWWSGDGPLAPWHWWHCHSKPFEHRSAVARL